MDNCKFVFTSLAAHFKLSFKSCPQFEDNIGKMSNVSYSSAVGSLMYAMICTRPTLSYVVSVRSRYMHNSYKDHWGM